MAYDPMFAGVPILYSWPSKGETLAYMADEDSAQEMQIHLEEFIADVAEKASTAEIYIIPQSMGSRPLPHIRDNMRLASRSCVNASAPAQPPNEK